MIGVMFRSGACKLLCDFFEKEWKKHKSEAAKIMHCLTWPPMKSFFEIFCKFYYLLFIYMHNCRIDESVTFSPCI